MARRRGASTERTIARTRLAEARLERGLTQREVAAFTGIPLSSYRRLERGGNLNPPLRWLVNCQLALALDTLGDVMEEEWFDWLQLSASAPDRPPDPRIIRARR